MEEVNESKAIQAEKITALGKIVKYLSKVVDPLSLYLVTVSCAMVTVMMFLTFVDVGGRYLFRRPIIGSFEITEFMMMLLISFGLAYCAYKKGHIRVDFVFEYLSKKTQKWFDIFAYLISFIFYIVVAWQSWISAVRTKASMSTSSLLYVPIYPFIFILVICFALLALIFLRDFLKSIEELKQYDAN